MSVDEANDTSTTTATSSLSSSASSTTSTKSPSPVIAPDATSLDQRAATEGLLIANAIANNGPPSNMSCRKYTRSGLLAIGKSLDFGTDPNELGKKLLKFETGQWRDKLEMMQEYSDGDKEQDENSSDQANKSRPKLVRSLTSFGRQRSGFERNCRDNQFRNFHTKDKRRQNSITGRNNIRLQQHSEQRSIGSAMQTNQISSLNRMVSSPQLRWSRGKDMNQNDEKFNLSSTTRGKSKLDARNKSYLSSGSASNNATRRSSLDVHSPLRERSNDVVTMQLRAKPKVKLANASKQPNSAMFSASFDNHMQIPPVIRIEARKLGSSQASKIDETYEVAASGETDEFDLSSLLSLTVFSDFNAIDSTINVNNKNKRDIRSSAGEPGKATRKMLKQHGRAKTMSDLSARKRNVGGKLSRQNSSLGMIMQDGEPIEIIDNQENVAPYPQAQEAEDGYYSIDLGVPTNYATSYMVTDQSSLLLPPTSSKKQIERNQSILDEKAAAIIENFKSQVKARASGKIDVEIQSKCQKLTSTTTTTTTKDEPLETNHASQYGNNNNRLSERKRDVNHPSKLQEKPPAAESLDEVSKNTSLAEIFNHDSDKTKIENPEKSQHDCVVTSKSELLPSRLPRLVKKVSLKSEGGHRASVASNDRSASSPTLAKTTAITDSNRRFGTSRIARAIVTSLSSKTTATSSGKSFSK